MHLKQLPVLNKDNNPGGARWCEKHQWLECSKRRRRVDEPCHLPAIRGIDACNHHSGLPKGVAMIKGEGQISAWSAAGRPGPAGEIQPGEAVMGMLQMSWLRVAAYGRLLKSQVETEGGDLRVDGLVGHKRGMSNSGEIYRVSEEIRALVMLEAQERDRCVKFAETAHKMGISDRLTSLAEQWGDVVAGRVVDMMSDLKLSAAQQKRLPQLLEIYLSSIDIMSIGAGGSEREE
jgi:hypothetical protein